MSNIVDGAKLFKPFTGHFADTIGLNRYLMAKGIGEVSEGLSSPVDTVQSFWNQDYRGFSHLGNGITSVANGALNIGISFAFGAGAWANRTSYGLFGRNATEAWKIGNRTILEAKAARAGWGGRTVIEGAGFIEKGVKNPSSYWLKGEAGALLHSSGDASRTLVGEEAAAMSARLKPATLFSKQNPVNLMKGRETLGAAEILGGGFQLGNQAGKFTRALRFLGTGKGMLALSAVQILGGMAVEKVTSLAGNLMDEAHLAYDAQKYPHYDTRQFNNRAMNNWGMNAMSAMGQYEMNNMSIARAYHSRG